MSAPLVSVQVMSIYTRAGDRVLLPARMAFATPDMQMALQRIGADVRDHGGAFFLSDLYRSYDMQLQAHMDYVTGKKKAFSPAPGASMHEAGRAFDVDLDSLRMDLSAFWKIVERHLVVPIIDTPTSGKSESWHFECRGSHQRVYDYYKAGKGKNFSSPAAAMAASAIVATGVKVDKFGTHLQAAQIQSALIRLGSDIGNLDGDIGPRTLDALEKLHLHDVPADQQLAAVELLLQKQFAAEYFEATPDHGLDD